MYMSQLDVSKIKNRRIKADILMIHKFQQKYNNELCKLVDYGEDYIKIQLKFTNKKLTVLLKFPVDYPWKVPNIFVNDVKYINLLKIHQDFLKMIGLYNTCLCCFTYVCGNNWFPVTKLTSLISEIRDNVKLKRRIVDKIFCKYIIKKYFWDSYPLPISDFL